METAVLIVFCIELVICVALSLPIPVALAIGLVLFLAYGMHKGCDLRELIRMGLEGIATAKGVLTAFILIGILTALWRASGTVSEIVLVASPFVTPAMAPLATFVLTGVMSFLTGTSFGTAATMGVVCMTMAKSMGADPLIIGGAILSGAYFGDRVSPLSTSALLVRVVTGTDLVGNFKAMMRSAALPLTAAVVVYTALGIAGVHTASGATGSAAITALAAYFDQGLVALVPALLVLVLPALRVSVKGAMGASIVAAAAVCLFARGIAPVDLVQHAIWGFSAGEPQIAHLMDGGGLISMVNVAVIVCLSSSYAGIFKGTGLLDGIQKHISALAARITPFGAVLAVSIPASMVACNQTLGIMLSHQLCAHVEPDARALALDLEDTTVVVSPLVPWSIACSAVVTMCGAPRLCFATAFYLWFIPAWRLACALVHKHRAELRGASAPAGVQTV